MPEEKKPSRKKIMASREMGRIMAEYFYELDAAAKDDTKKVAWCTSVGPAEILRAMGFYVYFPENHGAMLGATKMATDMIPFANAMGYSPDICSYLTSDVGAFLQNKTPLSKAYEGIEGVPKPDVLVFNTNQCRDVQDWFKWYGSHFDVPVIGIHTHRGVKEVTEKHIHSIAKQMEALVPPLEKVIGKPLDMEELKKVLGLSRECSELWKKVLDTAAAKPAPITFFDGTIHMGPAVVLRGTQQAVDYYKLLLEELEQRVKDGVAAVDGEKHRIYWEGMPVWGRLRPHSELFSNKGACVVASTYCNSWIFTQFDENDPWNSMARAYTELFIVRSDETKEEYIRKEVERFGVDGILFHDAKTCPNNSNNRYGMPERLKEDTGVPSLTINGDLNDMRCISDEQTATNVEAFIEQLDE